MGFEINPDKGFNPRARVRRDRGQLFYLHATDGFNPRARVRRDLTGRKINPPLNRFNPRARVRRDIKYAGRILTGFRFQSTRPREARPLQRRLSRRADTVSIHAPA